MLSRYDTEGFNVGRNLPKVSIDGQQVSPAWTFAKCRYNKDEIFHTVSAGEAERPDLISYTYYDSVHYWPYLLLYNGIHDPFFQIKAGNILRIPVERHVLVASVEINKNG